MGKDDQPPICDYEGSDYQERFWDRGNRAYEDQVEAVALRRLLPKRGALLLEVGAGTGRNTPRYQGYDRIVLLDYSLSQLQQAQERLGQSERYIYVAGDIYRLPFVDGLFDGATMIRTLHHMADVPKALQQVHQVLAPEAIFILEFANKHNLKAILRYALRRQEWNPFTLEPVEFAPLNFDFHPQAVRQWLDQAGFTIERQLTVSHFRLGILKRLFPLKVLVGLDALAQWTGNWWQLSPSVFIRARVSSNASKTETSAFFLCPECSLSPMPLEAHDLECPSCSSVWAYQNGIYNFRQPLGH
jgi:ubiquinone/menaquinone biosynthesis C-methylase UbiE